MTYNFWVKIYKYGDGVNFEAMSHNFNTFINFHLKMKINNNNNNNNNNSTSIDLEIYENENWALWVP
jgi:hypothetical protein